jgi:hypothetical protein
MNHAPTAVETVSGPPVWQAVLFAAMAGGMGWGIRGQYGHETGAMIAGLLVGLTLALAFCSRLDALAVARAVAWGTIAMGIGGSMTYGATVGLTAEPAMVGNTAALAWGLLGLGVKGAIWIGFAGMFLGMGLGGTRYRPLEMLLVMLGLIALGLVGMRLLNEPFDPEHNRIPAIYFSGSYAWKPPGTWRPRREVWGGLLAALVGLIAYISLVRRDRLGPRLACWGLLGGAIGFPLGQSLPAYHAWHRDAFRVGVWAWLDPKINWWNMMEITFGAVMGATLALGLWAHRRRIAPAMTAAAVPPAPIGVEALLLVVHLTLLVVAVFGLGPRWASLYDDGLVLAVVPIVAVAAGRWWPFFLMMPVTLLPIAGKTVRELVYETNATPEIAGWSIYLAIPMAVALVAAVMLSCFAARGRPAGAFLRPSLLLATWTYFGLNFAFFRFPWPWAAWTTRTLSGLIFTVCAVGLTLFVATARARTDPGPVPSS